MESINSSEVGFYASSVRWMGSSLETKRKRRRCLGEEVMGTGWGQDVVRMRIAIQGPVIGSADWNQRGLDFSSASTMY